MKFSAVFVVFGLVAAAAAQSSTASSEAPKESSSYTPEQQKCVEDCGSNLSCVAECFGNPAPTEDMVNATTECMGDCPQGNGTAAETERYAECQQKCISDQFFSNGSGSSGSSSSDNGSDSDSTPSRTSGGSSATGTSDEDSSSSDGSSSGASSPSASGSSDTSSGASSFAISGVAGVLAVVGAAVAFL